MPRYRHSHIVPQGYLRAWCDDGVLATGRPGSRATQLLPPQTVGVRRGFYAERQLDGTYVDRLEPAMSPVESDAVALMRSAEEHWPLGGSDRATLAEFMALQFVRTPAWRAWYEHALRNAIGDLRADGAHRPEVVAEASEFMRTDEERHRGMLFKLPLIGTLIANMHWTLLRTGAPRLATSDHPFAPVPISGEPAPAHPIPAGGLMNAAEFRFALSPRHLLLLTWLDEIDEPVGKLAIEHVRNHNSVVIAQAEEHWFHHPCCRAEHAPRAWGPISLDLYARRGYRPQTSRHRAYVQRVLDELNESDDARASIKLIHWDQPRAA